MSASRRGFIATLVGLAAAPFARAASRRFYVAPGVYPDAAALASADTYVHSAGGVIAGPKVAMLGTSGPEYVLNFDERYLRELAKAIARSKRSKASSVVGFALLLGFLWTSSLRADETDVRARETFCFETSGPNKGASKPCPKVDVSVLAGGLVSLSSDAGTALSPLARVLVSLPLGNGEGEGWVSVPPTLHVQVDLSALPGDSISLQDPETWRALEFRLGASQRVHDAVNADLYAEVGFATRLPGETQARDRAVRWAAAGVRVGRFDRGWLSLGMGADQRLDGTYRPAVLLSGAIALYDGEKLLDAHLFLTGDAILGLDTYGQPAPKRDVVRIGLAVGR